MRWRRRPAATGRTSTGPFRAFFAVFYFSLLVLRPLSPRSGALMCSNQYAKLLSSHPGKERYAVANSWLGFCAAKNRSAVQGVARRQGSAQEKGSVPQAGSEPRQGQVKAGSRPGRGQVTDRSRTGHRQVADKSHPGRRQVADRSRTGHRQRWVSEPLTSELCRIDAGGLAFLVLTDGRQRGCVASAAVNGRRAH